MSRAELKASILRGYVRWLVAADLFEAVAADVPPGVAALMRDLPPPTGWLLAEENTLPLVESLARLRDLPTVRRMSREATEGQIFVVMRPLVEGVLRLALGPEGVVRKLPFLLGSSARGITFDLDEIRERHAVLVMHTSGLAETRASAEAWAGAIEAVVALARVEPSVDVVAIRRGTPASEVRTRITWPGP